MRTSVLPLTPRNMDEKDATRELFSKGISGLHLNEKVMNW